VNIDSLGGYRLVRKLGEGDRAEVYLGHPAAEGATGGPVAIKVYRDDVSFSSVSIEAEALVRASGAHVVQLLDLTTGPSGVPALIFERLSSVSLARVLRDRTHVGVGEAITILSPMALALGRLHAAGVVHGGIGLESILFNGHGAPVIAGFGQASLIAPKLHRAALENEAGVHSDISDFASVAKRVMERVVELDTCEFVEWMTTESRADTSSWLDSISGRLFALGRPEPVRLNAVAEIAPAFPNRVVTAQVAVQSEPARIGPLAGLALPDWAESVIADGAILGRIRSSLSVVRARVWVIAGAVAAALIVASLVVPTNVSDATPGPTEAATVETTASPEPPSVVTGDDPVAALPLLLEGRERCIRDLSVLCLDDVGQMGSAALAADQRIIREAQEGAELPQILTVVPAEIVLEERLGNSALLSLGDVSESEPASILLMKVEAGWRIRDYLD
jgi:hypothetical protein